MVPQRELKDRAAGFLAGGGFGKEGGGPAGGEGQAAGPDGDFKSAPVQPGQPAADRRKLRCANQNDS